LKIHREALLIDGHNDLPYQYREKKENLSFASIDIARPQKALHTDSRGCALGGAVVWRSSGPPTCPRRR